MSPEKFESLRLWIQESMCQSGRRSFLWRLALGLSALTRYATSAQAPVHVFACSELDLSAIAKRTTGHEVLPYKIQRSSSGDHLAAFVYERSSEPRILVVSVRRPPVILAEADSCGLTDDLTFVAEGVKSGLRFRNGFVQEVPGLAVVVFAPGSLYYCVAGPDNITNVYATGTPGALMARANFVAQNIFCKGNRVYLFGFDRESKEMAIVGRVFRNVSGALNRESDFRIRPLRSAAVFAAVDLDPRSDQLLCTDSRDEFGAEWFIYDLRSGVLTDIGAAHPFGLFLQDDLIRLLRSNIKGADSVA